MRSIFEVPPGYSAEAFYTPVAARQRAQPDAEVDITVFISCYNERDLIGTTIDRVCIALHEIGRFSFELVVVDDCSVDGSATVVKEYIMQHPDEPLILRCNDKNRGLSQNYVDSSFFGIGTYYRLVCGDTSESIESMATVFSAIGSADIIIPYYPQVAVAKSHIRNLISGLYVALINVMAGQRLRYYNGLPVHRRFHVMRWHPTTRGFGFQADIICMLLEQGYTYKEVPVLVMERKESNSTALSFSNFLSVTHSIINIIIRRLARRVHEGNAKRRPREVAKLPDQAD